MKLYITVFDETFFTPTVAGLITYCKFTELITGGYDCSVSSLTRWKLP